MLVKGVGEALASGGKHYGKERGIPEEVIASTSYFHEAYDYG
jgi:hypothetical protein